MRAVICGGYRLVRDGFRIHRATDKMRVRSPRDVFDLMAPVAAVEDVENLWVLILDCQMRIMHDGWAVVSRGTLDTSLCHPREVFRVAIMSNAYAVILCHNHPSGDSTPSEDDISLTREMVAAGDVLGIKVVDHVVVTGDSFASIAEIMTLSNDALFGF